MRCHYLLKVSQDINKDFHTVPCFVNISSGCYCTDLTNGSAPFHSLSLPSPPHSSPNFTCVTSKWVSVYDSEVKTSKFRFVLIFRSRFRPKSNTCQDPCAGVMCRVQINPLKTKRRQLYLKTKFVPRSKHFSSRL